MNQKSDLLYFESCHTSWCFDTANLRFKRVPRPQSRPASATDFAVASWEPYFGLNFNDETDEFTVALNESESKLLRSWRHSQNCSHCFGDDVSYETEEISLGQLNELLDRKE